MPDPVTRLLIVDDQPSIRTSLSLVLTEIGYSVRCAGDGFAALSEFRLAIPDILLTDLNMPGMSGFELLSIVHRRFPWVRTIAMSGAFSGNEVLSGVNADAFFQKGSSVDSLLRIMGGLPKMEPAEPRPSSAKQPLWIQGNSRDASGKAYVTIECPECLRSFAQDLTNPIGPARTTDCIHCRSSIQYILVPPTEPAQGYERPSHNDWRISAGQPQSNQ